MGLVGVFAESFFSIFLVSRVVSFEPYDLTIAFESQDVRSDSI